jgi:hypothetical protein
MHLSNSQLGGYAFSVGESMHQSMVYFLVTLGFFFVFCFFVQFWPIVSWINYEYMPLQLRVLFHSFVASCW